MPNGLWQWQKGLKSPYKKHYWKQNAMQNISAWRFVVFDAFKNSNLGQMDLKEETTDGHRFHPSSIHFGNPEFRKMWLIL
jgi:hypothetical protein